MRIVADLARDAVRVSFLPAEDKAGLLDEIDRYSAVPPGLPDGNGIDM